MPDPSPPEPIEPSTPHAEASHESAVSGPRPDPPTIVGGLAITALGVLLLLDALEGLELGFAVLVPAALAALGAILLASGLSRPG